MSTREERRKSRNIRKNYFSSINEIKKARPNLFKKKIYIATTKRVIAGLEGRGPQILLLERTVRVRIDNKKFKDIARKVFLQLQEEFQNDHMIVEIVISANVILTKTDEEGKNTYSIYFGQYFPKAPASTSNEDKFRGASESERNRMESTQVCKPFRCKNVLEFNDKFPAVIDSNSIFDIFTRALNETSDVTVFAITNLVFSMICLIPSKKMKYLSNLKFGIPRIDVLPE